MESSQKDGKRAMFVCEGNVSNGVRDITERKKNFPSFFHFPFAGMKIIRAIQARWITKDYTSFQWQKNSIGLTKRISV